MLLTALEDALAGKRGPRPRRGPIRNHAFVATLAIAVGVSAATAFGFHSPDPWSFAGSSAMLAAATAVSGALVGFLFGIPRMVRGDNDRLPYAANTNLEQVSDWLTKILIGVGLTQLGTIGAWAGDLVSFVGPIFADGPTGTIFASSLIVYFTVLGFLAGWLVTRMFLGPALSHADRDALDQFIKAQAAEELGNHALARALRQEALFLSDDAARRYEELRAMPSNPDRTSQMEAIMETARKVAMAARLTKDEARAIFLKGTEGDRVLTLGLMEGDRRLADFGIALECITNSRSAFEQRHALTVMSELTSSLSTPEIAALRLALDAQMGPAGHIHESTRRRELARQLLGRLDALSAAAEPDAPSDSTVGRE